MLVVEYIFHQSHGAYNRDMPKQVFNNIKDYMGKLRKPIEVFVKNLQKIEKARDNKKEIYIKHTFNELIQSLTKVINPKARGTAAYSIGQFAVGIVNDSTLLAFEKAFQNLNDELMVGIIHILGTESIGKLLWHGKLVKNWKKYSGPELRKALDIQYSFEKKK